MATSAKVKVTRGTGVLATADGQRSWRVTYTVSATLARQLEGETWRDRPPDLRATVAIDGALAAELAAAGTPLVLRVQTGQAFGCRMADAHGTLVPREPSGA
jgi:hypothetical protein